MKTKKVTTGIAVVGVLAGAAGLAIVTVPAGADPAPQLPKVSPESLVSSVLQAKPAQFGGTMSATSNLGIPLPELKQGTDGDYSAQVYYGGADKFRLTSAQQGGSQHTTVSDGSTLWNYDSKGREVSKLPMQHAKAHEKAMQERGKGDPVAMSKQLVGKLRESSDLTVDGTARVADRDAYELVLTPKPSEKTLVREVRVAVDAQTRMPLRFEAFGNGSADPALEFGFTKLDVGQQDPALFSFTPPQGAKVTTVDPSKHMDKLKKQPKQQMNTVGEGWDTVLTGKLDTKNAKLPQGEQGKQEPGQSNTPAGIMDRFAKPVHGAYGNGHLISTSIGTALITDDGRFAAGLVPQQVLEQALGTK
ncbi:LolA family protein [Sciscionella sediminilitoris]|uniref:LolA family protein n=1 Tax=Sciscionella sediminilitoris TaxID=1445613 RepID=UPI0004DF1786|nr:hypothetical protein [Sciscionella sp. SE31]